MHTLQRAAVGFSARNRELKLAAGLGRALTRSRRFYYNGQAAYYLEEDSLTPEQAVSLRDFLVAGIESEMPTTRRVVTAIPDDKRDYRPDPKARTAWELAWHLVVSDAWFLAGVAKGDFSGQETPIPPEVKTVADMVAWHEANVPPLLAQVRALDGEKLAKEIDFFGAFKFANVVYLNFQLVHAVHHRGFLAAYLRPMGSKIPSIYGGSADEPFEMAAQQG